MDICTSPTLFPVSPPRASGASPWQRLAGLVQIWRQRVRTRRALSTLDARLLRDIGVEPGAAWHEITKPFWRA